MEQFALKSIARSFNITDLQERAVPTDEDVEGIVAQRVVAALEAELRSRGSLEKERMRRFIPLGRSLAEAEEESPLIAMLLDEYYQRTLQAAPLSPSGEPEEEKDSAPDEPMPAGRPPGGPKKRPRRRSGRGRGGERSGNPA
jgi:ATP-dependent RNA helicase DeaD